MIMIDASIKIVYEMGMEVHREDDFQLLTAMLQF